MAKWSITEREAIRHAKALLDAYDGANGDGGQQIPDDDAVAQARAFVYARTPPPAWHCVGCGENLGSDQPPPGTRCGCGEEVVFFG
jgi:hypothetical protein